MNQTPNPFENISKLIERMQPSGLELASLSDARRKDLEALVEANRIAFEGMQALAAKQVEVFQSTMAELQSSMPVMASAGQVGDVTKQAELAQRIWQKAIADMRELAEVARKSQVDALATIGQRATENLQGMRRMAQKK